MRGCRYVSRPPDPAPGARRGAAGCGPAFDVASVHDHRNELTSAIRTAGGPNTWAYDYDPGGNRQTSTVGADPALNCSGNRLNQYTSSDDQAGTCPDSPMPTGTFGYDADGKLTADSGSGVKPFSTVARIILPAESGPDQAVRAGTAEATCAGADAGPLVGGGSCESVVVARQ